MSLVRRTNNASARLCLHPLDLWRWTRHAVSKHGTNRAKPEATREHRNSTRCGGKIDDLEVPLLQLQLLPKGLAWWIVVPDRGRRPNPILTRDIVEDWPLLRTWPGSYCPWFSTGLMAGARHHPHYYPSDFRTKPESELGNWPHTTWHRTRCQFD